MSDPREHPRHHHWLLLGTLAVGVIAAGLIAGLLVHHRHAHERAERRERARLVERGPRVYVARVALPSPRREVTLPGDVRAFAQTTVYAKVSGYLREILVDKGDRVRAGQVIARIASPETDAQVIAAAADVVAKRAAAERARRLAPAGVVTRQDLDNAVGAYRVAEATLVHNRALRDYEIVRAPFDGVVVGRYADPGALVPAATGSTASALPLVDISDEGRVRVTVFVGQDVAAFLHVGDAAIVLDDQHPERRIEARVSRLTSALDPRSRTMLCEIWLDNRTWQLLPGVFVHVTLALVAPPLPTLPSQALFTRGADTLVAKVEGGRLRFTKVVVGEDDGKRVQIVRGVTPGEVVAVNPPSELGDGARIQPAEQREAKRPADGAAQQGSAAPQQGDAATQQPNAASPHDGAGKQR